MTTGVNCIIIKIYREKQRKLKKNVEQFKRNGAYGMAKVNQNKVIGALIVAIITLLVVIVIVVIAKGIFPSNSRETSNLSGGTGTYHYNSSNSTTTTTTTAGNGSSTDTESSTATQSSEVTSTEPRKIMYVQNYVYMRSGPGTDSEIIITLSKGLEVEVVKLEEEWYEIIWNGQTGYVYQSYLGDAPPATDTTTTTTAAVAEPTE